MSNKITQFLWFKNEAGEAMDFYCSVFKNSKIISKSKGPDGNVFSGVIDLDRQQIYFLNMRNETDFNEGFSLFVNCETQEEVDYFWDKFTADGGAESRCGWLVDKFGISWQIIPSALMKLMNGPDREKGGRVMNAMLQMNKIIIADLEKAYNGN